MKKVTKQKVKHCFNCPNIHKNEKHCKLTGKFIKSNGDIPKHCKLNIY